jgi:hypothetical protein
MVQQTAMQTLIAWGDEMLLKHPQKILSFGEAIDKAVELLQMEKEQIITAACYDPFLGNLPKLEGEKYYNETYKTK